MSPSLEKFAHVQNIKHFKIFINYSFVYIFLITSYSIEQNKSMKYFRNFRKFVHIEKIVGKHCHISIK